MSFKKSYKLSWLERKKEIDQQAQKMQLEDTKTIEAYHHHTADEHLFALDITRKKIPYIIKKQSQLCFTIVNFKAKTMQDIIQTLQNYDPTIQTKFYHSEEEGNITTFLFRFANIQNSSKAYKILTQQLLVDVVWCSQPHEPQLKRPSNPQSPLLKKAIDRLSKNVARYGIGFQNTLVKLNHPLYQFINHPNSCEYEYYRWKTLQELFKLFKIPSQDTFYGQQTSPFVLSQNGSYIYPPSLYKSPRVMTKEKRIYFNKMLNALSSSKDNIAKLMVYAIKNQEYSAEISIIITQQTYSSDKQLISRIYLLSDILHNSLALRYPAYFKILLPNFFYRAVQRKISQQTRKEILNVLKIWKHILIFDDEFFEGLEFTLGNLQQIPSSLHVQLLNKSYEEVYDECIRLGVPTIGSFHLHLSKYLQYKEMKSKQRVEEIYDGIPLTRGQIQKIKSNTIDVMTYHSLEYLSVKRADQ